MSAFPGNSQAGATTDASEGDTRPGPGQRDVEQGDLDTEKQRYSPNPQEAGYPNDENIEDGSDEYTRLLKFIDIEAKKAERGRDQYDGEDEEQEMRRLWYMPWKKVVVKSATARKVPQSWLETDMSQGLSDSEVIDRRARFGYNELERCAKPHISTPAESLSCTA